ncbi:alkaline phosphatase: placental-like protein [Leptotrombidium deliense]|uniref:alkaline phosphatase n=1 Tax=Leptotrombidium deliense TaxID=299467 RepID=A0A443S794_9ACAR|nr:alkaline phosphatase: placental-like protein [Leptotrombidium deliense]
MKSWSAPDYQQYAAVHTDEALHTGEDVAVYSEGPMAYLFHGTQDQTFIAHVAAFATCIGDYTSEAHCSHMSNRAARTKDIQ